MSERRPRRSEAEDSPVVYIRARMTFEMALAVRREPLWVEAELQVSPDRSVELLWLTPQYGVIHGSKVKEVLDLYKDAIVQAAEDTNLAILGVVP